MKSKLNFINFVVPKFFFDKQVVGKDEDSFEISPRVAIDKSKKQFHVNFDLEISDHENSFVLKMFAVGIFDYEADDEGLLHNFIAINGPALIFPYIRGFISSFTAQSGFDTITLPTLNLLGFKQEILDNLIDIGELKDE